jgi:lipoprotein signal peptidase
VADSCICVAAGLFILGSFLDGKRKKAQPSLR